MAYPVPLVRVQYLFESTVGGEKAQTGYMVEPGAAATAFVNAMVQIDAEALMTSFANIWNSADIDTAEYSKLVGLKVAPIGTAGTYLGEAKTFARGGTAIVGNNAGVPPQCSVCVSFSSSESLGRANHGRMYLPFTKVQQGIATPYGAPVPMGAFATTAQTWFASTETTLNLIQAGSRIVIASKLGVLKDVKAIKVGNLTDTQRRRRRQLPETYITRAV